MNIRPANNYTNDYPIYLNPTSEEIDQLVASCWDTIRILLIDDANRFPEPLICLASGYGNTHETLAWALKVHFGRKRVWTTPSILFYDHDRRAFFNAGDMGGPDKVRASRALDKYFSEFEADVLRRIIVASDLEVI